MHTQVELVRESELLETERRDGAPSNARLLLTVACLAWGGLYALSSQNAQDFDGPSDTERFERAYRSGFATTDSAENVPSSPVRSASMSRPIHSS